MQNQKIYVDIDHQTENFKRGSDTERTHTTHTLSTKYPFLTTVESRLKTFWLSCFEFTYCVRFFLLAFVLLLIFHLSNRVYTLLFFGLVLFLLFLCDNRAFCLPIIWMFNRDVCYYYYCCCYCFCCYVFCFYFSV